MRRAVAYAVVAAAALTILLSLVRRANSLEPGLTALYADDSSAGSSPPRTFSRTDRPPFSAALESAWAAARPAAFSVTWSGQLTVLESGTYTLAVNADAGSSLFVDGRTIFDNVRHPEDQFASGQAELSRGSHAIFVAYANRGASPRLELLWGRGAGALSTIPAWQLHRARASEARVRLSAFLDELPPLLGWLWSVLLAAIGVQICASIAGAAKRVLERAGLWREARWILAGSFLLSITGLWWGLPAEWVPIELTPTFVLDGLTHHFSNGWYDAYPPLHYYVLSAAIAPMLVLHWLTGIDIYGIAGHTILVVIFRLVSVAAGLGCVMCASVSGAEVFGKRAGLLAGAVFALTTPFLFYSKTANVDVPYLFWFTASIVFYVRLVKDMRLRDFVGLAATAACAVCTKDQAYGLYVLVPLVVVERVWTENRRRHVPGGFVRALVDRRIVTAAFTAAALFAAFHNLLFNFHGFMGHIGFITGPGSETYRIYEPTLAGRWTLFVLSARLIQQSMGWPLFAAGVAGVLLAFSTGKRLLAAYLLVPVISYYVFFIDVILYNYDRFMLPMCFVLAIFAGAACDALLTRAGRARPAALAAVAGAFVYTLLYAGTVDVLMLRDSRSVAEEWITANVGTELIGVTELPELIPSTPESRTVGLASVEELQRERPRFFVLNTDYARAAAPGSYWAKLVNGLSEGALGYRRVARFRSPSPWPWLPGAHPDLAGPREDTMVFSVLRDINPTIDIFERKP